MALPKGKSEAVSDGVAIPPKKFYQIFKTNSIKKICIDTDMLELKSKLCPDVDGIVSAFKVDWSKFDGGIE